MSTENQILNEIKSTIKFAIENYRLNAYDLNDNDPSPTNIRYNNKIYSHTELNDMAVSLKREGKYTESLEIWFALLKASLNQNKRINIWIIQGIYKVLICINELYSAFELVLNVNVAYYDSQIRNLYTVLFDKYFKDLMNLAMSSKIIIDQGTIFGFCAKCSGSFNYQMIKNKDEIKIELERINDFVDKNILKDR